MLILLKLIKGLQPFIMQLFLMPLCLLHCVLKNQTRSLQSLFFKLFFISLNFLAHAYKNQDFFAA